MIQFRHLEGDTLFVGKVPDMVPIPENGIVNMIGSNGSLTEEWIEVRRVRAWEPERPIETWIVPGTYLDNGG